MLPSAAVTNQLVLGLELSGGTFLHFIVQSEGTMRKLEEAHADRN